ncbi:MAG: hypothetical protein COA47_18145 [Robiginitomaculum sp.]|nr:MAG: hypothetical protein COA47_18145 [Robiginitomaculum sp.]
MSCVWSFPVFRNVIADRQLDDAPYSADLIVGEGLENTLSIGSALPEYDLAACLTANHLAVFVPPISARRIWIARDGDDV